MKKVLPIILSLLSLTSCTARKTAVSSYLSPSQAQSPASSDSPSVATYRQITVDEAVVMMENEEGYIILDVRRPDEFSEAHIPGAINVPNESIGSEEIPELPDKNQLIMVYCRSGRRSKEAAEKLVKLGYTNVVEFGGILDWKGETVSENADNGGN